MDGAKQAVRQPPVRHSHCGAVRKKAKRPGLSPAQCGKPEPLAWELGGGGQLGMPGPRFTTHGQFAGV